ncbi:MAG TPA: ROK family transcriptional regulator [Blastocatellia bacterium]|nr:ROK family transcriptional regulator [Blastocatellia bacterium]
MRRINPHKFQIAKRGTSREINRQIALNLIRTHQPISRADLARLMGLRRGAVTLIVNELLEEGIIFEGMTGEAQRGRKPTFLYVDSRGRSIIAVDIRVTRTYILLTDWLCRPLAGPLSFPTDHNMKKLVAETGRRVKQMLADHPEAGDCQGVGLSVPGMVERSSGRILVAPTLEWHDVDIKEPLAAATGLPVHIENSGRACALAQMWAARSDAAVAGDLAFVTVSDGIGVGIIAGGELLRGRHNIAGEFGHVPLSIDGPRCSCGSTGCWEAYISNLATLSRYFGRTLQDAKLVPAEIATFSIDDLIARARSGDAKAVTALQSTGRYLGLGLASLINAIDPARIYIGGEITAAWDMIETIVRAGMGERTLAPASGDPDIRIVSPTDYPRLHGAAALVAAPAFAAPAVA